MTAPTRFEDRLFDQLRAVVAERPAPAAGARVRARPRRRARLVLAGAGVVAATAVAAIVAGGGDVDPAYAVQSRADGSVTVQIHSLRDAAGLQSKLRAAGVPAVVDYAGSDCAAPPRGADGPSTNAGGGPDSGRSLSGPGPGPGATTTALQLDSDGATFTIDPGGLKSGQKVYITTSTGEVTSLAMAIGTRPPAAPCG
jgi:hypothetical protein